MTNTQEVTNRLVAAVSDLSVREGVQLNESNLNNNYLDLNAFLLDSKDLLSPELITNITNVATK